MKYKSFAFLWSGQVLANSGDVFYIVGMIAGIYSLFDSAFVAALFPFINTAALFLSGFLAPLLIDRYRLKNLLVYSQVGKTLLLLLLSLYYVGGGESINLVLVFSLVFLISFLDGWANPAKSAMLPRIVPQEKLVKINSFVSVSDQLVFMGGWACGGILVGWLGESMILLITFVLYVLSTILMCFLEDHYEANQERSEGRASFYEGWLLIWRVRKLRVLHVIFLLGTVANTVWIAAIIYIYVREQLQASEAWWGYINTSFFIGMLLGGLVAMRITDFIQARIRHIIILTSILAAIATGLFGLTTAPWVALLLSLAFGFFESVRGVAAETILQRSVEVDKLPKVYAAQSAMIAITFGVASLTVGFIADIAHISVPFLLAGCLIMSAALYAFWNRRTLKLQEGTG
ncbi:MAG: MFS transporter [Bacillus sp. (in: firmicutes)]